ncbi:GNAT family N-acetyltransferase [Microbacterium sp. Clip185]|uniref:GNAT family N-acetyltransferase n=1 Tax=Microbacterium sp. Clip185 TaxID=3025663 RepID=UPI0023663F00|nr:GNAT family N-acetyltransferase [Microbacterium sp. Clip185]WDG16745.1 GNAT family N-acetyltransferase [Microbacterium sp. Clip185]
MDTLTTLELRPVEVPTDLDRPAARDFHRLAAIRNEVYREISGTDDDRMTPGELAPFARSDAHELRLHWLVLLDDEPVGRMGMDLPQEDGSRTSYVFIELRRDVWGQGIGERAHALLEETARAHGRSVMQSWVEHPAADGEQLTPPTGFGHVPLDHPARFLLRHGYTLEQIVRKSAFTIAGNRAELEQHAADARAASTDYRVVQWEAPTPDEFVEGYAWMKSRMSTDAPSADLVVDEETWDAARVRTWDADILDGGRRMLVTAAQHIATGELCAFNELVLGVDPEAASHQYDTLVLSTHRGHRLGMLVKAEGLLAWPRVAPASTRVVTYNAEENRPMLDINEAIGFVPVSYEGVWKRVLS